MNQTYAQLQKQIASLEAKAAEIKRNEVAEVVAKIKEAIEVYSLTAQDLFGGRGAAGSTRRGRSAQAKYGDGQGNTWVGRGPRPAWLRNALAAGRSLEEFAVGGAPAARSKPAAADKPAKRAKAAKKSGGKRKGAGQVKFKDEAGNSWTGFGPKPKWLKDAVAAGQSIEKFRV
jgi:DNA-binding protein H-NS